jgi:hypothetical protein
LLSASLVYRTNGKKLPKNVIKNFFNSIRIDAVAPYRDYDEKRDKTGWIFYPEFAKIEDPIEVTETVFPSFPSYPPATVSF